MLACARIGAVHSVVFGGFAAHELAVRIDDATPKVVVSASCGIEVSRVIEYKPILDRAMDLAGAQAGALRDPAAAAGAGGADRGPRPGLGAGDGQGRARRLRPGRGDRPAVHPVHLGHHGQAQGRGPGQRRPRGRAALEHGRPSTTPGPARCSGPPPTWAGWSATPTSSTRRCWPGAPPCCTRASRSAPPTPARSGGSSPSTRSRRCSPRRPRSARSRRKTRAATLARRYDLSSFRYLFLAGERLDPETYRWAGELLGVPVIDHWWQTETGWPIAATCWAWSPMPTKPGSPTVPVPGYDVRILDADGTEATPGADRGDRGPAAAAAGLPAHPVARRRAVHRRPTCRSTRATTSPATAATATPTATCT